MASYLGRITRDPTVTCLDCEQFHYLSNGQKESSAKAARSIGFHYIPRVGWVCRDCWGKRKEREATGNGNG